MGCAIAKFAFHPPDPSYTKAMLQKDPQHKLILNTKGEKVSLLHFVSAAGALRPVKNGQRYVLLFSHGNAEDLGQSYMFFKTLCAKLLVDVVAYDYSGYGLSEGTCSEESAFNCAEAAFEYVVNTLKTPPGNIILAGRSLGSGPATHLAANNRGLGGLILLSPLCSAAKVAGCCAGCCAYPCDIFTNIRKVNKIKDFPVLIIHGTIDEVINVSHGKELHSEISKINPRTTLELVEGASHNDVEIVMGATFFSCLAKFVHTLHLPQPTLPQQEKSGCFS